VHGLSGGCIAGVGDGRGVGTRGDERGIEDCIADRIEGRHDGGFLIWVRQELSMSRGPGNTQRLSYWYLRAEGSKRAFAHTSTTTTTRRTREKDAGTAAARLHPPANRLESPSGIDSSTILLYPMQCASYDRRSDMHIGFREGSILRFMNSEDTSGISQGQA